jgi:hypothetical protein
MHKCESLPCKCAKGIALGLGVYDAFKREPEGEVENQPPAHHEVYDHSMDQGTTTTPPPTTSTETVLWRNGNWIVVPSPGCA